MPTGKDKLNPAGLMRAAKTVKEIAVQQQKLLSKLSSSKSFAASFDEAIMNEDLKKLKGLIKQGGITDKFSIQEIDPDRRIIIVVIRGKGKVIVIIIY